MEWNGKATYVISSRSGLVILYDRINIFQVWSPPHLKNIETSILYACTTKFQSKEWLVQLNKTSLQKYYVTVLRLMEELKP